MKMAMVLLMALAPALVRAEEPADVALVLAVDVSLSMDFDEQLAQREGYVAALTDPAVLDAIARGRRGRIALAYVEWGGPWSQRVVAPWTIIAGPGDAAAFAGVIAAADMGSSRGTSISAALSFAADYLDAAPPADRRVIDVSGDGPNNMGGLVTEARDRVLARGIEINGLPLMLKEPDLMFSIAELDIYYEECVVGGPSAFVIPVLHVSRFASAIRQKLVLEIAARAPVRHAGAPVVRVAGRIGCRIGEQLYERWRRAMQWQ